MSDGSKDRTSHGADSRGRDERCLAAEYVSFLLHFAIIDWLEQTLHSTYSHPQNFKGEPAPIETAR